MENLTRDLVISEIKDLIIVIAHGLVLKSENVFVEVDENAGDGLVVLRLNVDHDDMGRVIGRHGKIAKSIRQLVKSVAIREKIKIALEIG